MTRKRASMDVWTCDGCGHEEVHEPNGDPPIGYHGAVYVIHGGGGSGRVKWWAHEQGCIEKAVLAALEKDEAR